MRTYMVDVVHVLREYRMELSFTEDQQVVQAFTPHTAQKAFTDCIRLGCLYGCVQNYDSGGVADLIEHRSELVIVVPNQKARCCAPRRGIP